MVNTNLGHRKFFVAKSRFFASLSLTLSQIYSVNRRGGFSFKVKGVVCPANQSKNRRYLCFFLGNVYNDEGGELCKGASKYDIHKEVGGGSSFAYTQCSIDLADREWGGEISQTSVDVI